MPAKAKPVLFDDVTAELTYSPAISEEEKTIIEERMRALDQILAEEQIAKYKLEVMFVRSRSFHKPFPGIVTFWENGSKLHGGGDAKLYQCPGKHLGKNECDAIIPDLSNGLNFIVCPTCKGFWKGEHVIGEVFYNLPVQKWVDVLLSWFLKLEMNADIRIKYARDDLRSAAEREQNKQMMGELLEKVRSEERRTAAIYRLANIVKDTSAGADLRGRIHAFLTA